MNEEQAQIENWVTLYGDHLYSWATYRLQDDNLAKDMVQETFISAMQSWDRFEGRSSIKTWLTSILNNKIRDQFRKNKRRMFSLEDMAGERPVDDYFDSLGAWKPEFRPSLFEEDTPLLDLPDFRNILYQCIDGLNDRFRKVIIGKFLDTKESEEICQELDITPSNFWQILHRARLQLRNCLDVNWFKPNQ